MYFQLQFATGTHFGTPSIRVVPVVGIFVLYQYHFYLGCIIDVNVLCQAYCRSWCGIIMCFLCLIACVIELVSYEYDISLPKEEESVWTCVLFTFDRSSARRHVWTYGELLRIYSKYHTRYLVQVVFLHRRGSSWSCWMSLPRVEIKRYDMDGGWLE